MNELPLSNATADEIKPESLSLSGKAANTNSVKEYIMIAGKERFQIRAPETLILQSKKLTRFVREQDPERKSDIIILPEISRHEICFVLEYIQSLTTKPSTYKPSAVEYAFTKEFPQPIPAHSISPLTRYTWGKEHGVEALCTELLDFYKDKLSSPMGVVDIDWSIISLPEKNPPADSELSNLLLDGKAWQMRYFGSKNMH